MEWAWEETPVQAAQGPFSLDVETLGFHAMELGSSLTFRLYVL